MSWRELLEVARWAPSPHNVQTWRLRPLGDARAGLLYDPRRLLPATDPDSRFVACGLGCFVEALSLAAAPQGLAVRARVLPDAPDARRAAPSRFAELELVPAHSEEPLAPELLLARRTSRLPYDGAPVATGVLDELEGIATACGHRLTATSEPRVVRDVVELNRETLFLDMRDDAARREVGSWLRFSGGEAARRRDGFSPACLGFPGPLLWLFFHAHPLLELPGLRGATRALYGRTMHGTATVAWLEGPFARREECFEAGRMLLRLWLTLTRHGLQLHPFGSTITNPTAYARLQELLGLDDRGWLVMRLGRSAEPPRSLRLETDELLAA